MPGRKKKVVVGSSKSSSTANWRKLTVLALLLTLILASAVYCLTNNTNTNNGTYFFPKWSPDWTKVLQKREEHMRKYSFQHSRSLQSIDRRSALTLTLQEFRDIYDAKWPVIITDCVNKWPAYHKWTRQWFIQQYGDQRVGMSATPTGEIEDAQQMALPMKHYISHLDMAGPQAWTYLQDELFLPKRPQLFADIQTCDVLAEDWFPLFPKDVQPWWAFLLWGTAYSRSTLHMDPYNWTGTNAVISGRKRWRLFPPGQDHLLYPVVGRCNFPLDCTKYNSAVDTFSEKSLRRYPLAATAEYMQFEVLPGELLVIPTGWFHQAFNVEPTLAVAGQIFNSGNHRMVLEEVFKVEELPRGPYPAGLEGRPALEQVKTVLAEIGASVLAKGRTQTQNQLDQVEKYKNTPPPPPKKEL